MQFTSPGPQVGAVIPGKAQISSACFHEDGRFLFAASSDDSRLQIIDCQAGKQISSPLRFEREGISLVEATHHDQCILFSGKGSPDQQPTQRHAVNYHSIYDNKILRKFRGHIDVVNNISMNPSDDTFLTSSLDRTVRLWSLSQAGPIGKMDLPEQTEGEPYAVFDSTGLVFGVAASMAGGQGHYIHLYDARNYAGGAFAEMKVITSQLEKATTQVQAKSPWTSFRFNALGNQMLVTGQNGLVVVLDGYEGTIQRSFSSTGVNCACWTPDDKTVLTGNDEGHIMCWNVDTGAMIRKLEGHPGSVSWVGVNAKYNLFASCDANTALWIW